MASDTGGTQGVQSVTKRFKIEQGLNPLFTDGTEQWVGPGVFASVQIFTLYLACTLDVSMLLTKVL